MRFASEQMIFNRPYRAKGSNLMRRLLLIAMLTVASVPAAFAQPSDARAGGPAATSKKDFFPVEQVKPGMRAIGYTVFAGSEPEPFEVEILGVLKGFPNPQQSAILSKLVGPRVNHTGVFQGMSGSPVYIEGKLLGAVAFGYQFAKDPIAGITPIQHMIEVFEEKPGGDGKDQQPGQPRQELQEMLSTPTLMRTGARDYPSMQRGPARASTVDIYRRRPSAAPGKKGAAPKSHLGFWLYG